MADLELKLACWDYDRTRPLIDGRVKPEGIKLDIEVLRPRQMFPRMLEHHAFDVCEMSLASHASLIGRGNSPFFATRASMCGPEPASKGPKTCAASASEQRNSQRPPPPS